MRGWRVDADTRFTAVVACLLVVCQPAIAYTLDLNSTDSIKSVAKLMAEDMMLFYNGDKPGGKPGLLPPPYYWWEAGALMGAPGDATWNNRTQEGLLNQVGPNNDYMPKDQILTEGNDDQGFWGMAVMSAAEHNFQNPPGNKPGWLALAQAVFNTQAARWETQDCGGGLRWQIFVWNAGYNYKNSISQACFFNIGARLALYTGNQTYAEWADKTWDWMIASGFMKADSYYVYDGAHVENCSDIVPYQWTYNAGGMLIGAAAMYNYTTGAARQVWKERVDGLLDGIMVACEPVRLCNLDQQSFKAYLSRWMAATTKWAPWTYDRIKPLLESSALAATSTCTGGANGRMCGLVWTEHSKWDGSTGVGQQMAAMQVVLGNLIKHVSAPVTNGTGGTSIGNASAGGSDVGEKDPFNILGTFPPATIADRAGAYFLTVVVLVGVISAIVVMLIGETDCSAPKDRLPSVRAVIMAEAGRGAGLLRKRRRPDSRVDKGKAIDRSDSDGSLTPEKDIVVKIHNDLSAEEADDLPARRHRSAPQSDVSYWSGNMTASEQRLSCPMASRRHSLRKKAMLQNQLQRTERDQSA